MSIIEKKRTDLLISEPIKKVDIPEFDGYNYIKTELDKLKKVEDKNIQLALRLKEIREKYNEIKHQYQIQCNLLSKLNKLNFTLYCPLLKKDIDIYVCQDACVNKLCTERYDCLKRIESIKHYFNV